MVAGVPETVLKEICAKTIDAKRIQELAKVEKEDEDFKRTNLKQFESVGRWRALQRVRMTTTPIFWSG